MNLTLTVQNVYSTFTSTLHTPQDPTFLEPQKSHDKDEFQTPTCKAQWINSLLTHQSSLNEFNRHKLFSLNLDPILSLYLQVLPPPSAKTKSQQLSDCVIYYNDHVSILGLTLFWFRQMNEPQGTECQCTTIHPSWT